MQCIVLCNTNALCCSMYNIPFVVVKCIVQLYSITVTVSCCICTVRYEYSCMY